jgi:hypothetical protein
MFTSVDDSKGSALWRGPPVYGTEYQLAESLSLSSASNGSSSDDTDYVQKIRLSTTNLPVGDYRIAWHYRWAGSKNNRSFIARIEIDDTTQMHYHEQEAMDAGTDQFHINSGFKKITMTAGTHSIDLDFKSSSASFTAYISDARLELFRIS